MDTTWTPPCLAIRNPWIFNIPWQLQSSVQWSVAVDFPVVPDPPKCHQNTEALHLQQCRVWHSSRPHWPRHPPPPFSTFWKKWTASLQPHWIGLQVPSNNQNVCVPRKSTPVKVFVHYYGLAHRMTLEVARRECLFWNPSITMTWYTFTGPKTTHFWKQLE